MWRICGSISDLLYSMQIRIMLVGACEIACMRGVKKGQA